MMLPRMMATLRQISNNKSLNLNPKRLFLRHRKGPRTNKATISLKKLKSQISEMTFVRSKRKSLQTMKVVMIMEMKTTTNKIKPILKLKNQLLKVSHSHINKIFQFIVKIKTTS